MNKCADNSVFFIKNLLNNTRYVAFDEFKSKLLFAFSEFRKIIGNRKFCIPIDCDKFGSESWLCHLLWPEISACSNFVNFFFLTEATPPADDILIIDDCMYTGSQTYTNLVPIHFKEYQQIHCVVPFYSEVAVQLLMNMVDEKNKHLALYVHGSDVIIPLKQLPFFKKSNLIDNLDRKLFIDFNAYPIYFDHKVAGEFSSFPSIYLDGAYVDKDGTSRLFGPLLTTTPTREMIEYVADIYALIYNVKAPCPPPPPTKKPKRRRRRNVSVKRRRQKNVRNKPLQ